MLAPTPVSSSPLTEIGTPILETFADAGKDAERADFGMTDQLGGDETPKPKSPNRPVTFPFLSPPLGPDEIGRMAHYKVIRLLGQGGMGIVFEAIDAKLQRSVALKVMKPDIAQDDLARKRFLREARMTASVKSDHVVVIHDVGQINEVPFLAMELMHGEPLEKRIETHGRPTLEETLRIGREVAQGLAAAHDLGLIHRDIKPANIWLETSATASGKSDASPSSPRQPSFRVKILDFGLARIAQDKGQLTHSGMVLGTPAYMAPEQAEAGEVDARCDLFSLGCVLYEMATGAKPFSGTNTMAILMSVAMKAPLPPHELNPDLPPSLCDLIMRLLAKKPLDRPESAQQVAMALQAIADELGISGQTPTSGIRRGSGSTMTALAFVSPRRRKWTIGFAVTGGLLAIGLLGLGLYLLPGARDQEILLGMSGPLNGPSKELGREMEIGIRTYINHINDQGGVNGRKLNLIALDDEYEPDQALANMVELHEKRKVFAVIGNIGTPTALVTVPYAVENKLIFFGAFTGAKVLRKDPPERYVFNYRASYEEETAKIVEYLVERKKIPPEAIAVFDQRDGFGDAGFGGVVKVMRKYKRESWDILRVRYERNTIMVKDAADQILQKPEIKAVVMVGTYKPITEFIRQIKDAKRDNIIFTNVSFVGSEALALGLKEHGYADGVIVTQVVPPIDSNASIVLKYHELRKKYFPNEHASFTSLEGYISTALFVEGLKRAGDHPTSENVIQALETIRDFDLGTGAPLTFTASEHQASHKVWATVLDKAGNFKVLDMTE
jgi:serine/threonine protein kinase/ABC-type branched-subunit amino acid transport system substrate-binding protein